VIQAPPATPPVIPTPSLDALLPHQPTRHPADDVSQSVSETRSSAKVKVGQQLGHWATCLVNRPRHSTHARTQPTFILRYLRNKAIVNIRLRPRSDAAARGPARVFAAVSNPCCPLLSHFQYTPSSRCLFLAIVCKHDVINKTEIKWRNAAR